MLVIVKSLHEELIAVGEQLRFIADFCGKEANYYTIPRRCGGDC